MFIKKKHTTAYVFFILFTLFGYLIGNQIGIVVNEYRIEKKIQWSWEGVETDKKVYEKCDEVILTGYRESSVDATITSITELVRIESGKEIEVYRYPEIKASVNNQKSLLSLPIELPCENIDIPEGTYRLQGSVQIDYQHDTNSFSWKGSSFVVLESFEEMS